MATVFERLGLFKKLDLAASDAEAVEKECALRGEAQLKSRLDAMLGFHKSKLVVGSAAAAAGAAAAAAGAVGDSGAATDVDALAEAMLQDEESERCAEFVEWATNDHNVKMVSNPNPLPFLQGHHINKQSKQSHAPLFVADIIDFSPKTGGPGRLISRLYVSLSHCSFLVFGRHTVSSKHFPIFCNKSKTFL